MTREEFLTVAEINTAANAWDYIYHHYGVYDNKMLFEAMEGTFASTAWIKSDEEYNDTLGQKFKAITGDDNLRYNLSRGKIRRLKSKEEFIELLNNKSCDDFRNSVIAMIYY